MTLHDLAPLLRSGAIDPTLLAPSMEVNERDFQNHTIGVAQALGWRVAHFRPAMLRSGKWATPVQADGAGFPDLVLVRGERLLFLELKAQGGRLRPEQRAWLEALGRVPHVTAGVIRPSDWPTLIGLLTCHD